MGENLNRRLWKEMAKMLGKGKKLWMCLVTVSIILLLGSCGKYSHISKILKDDATEASVNWLNLIRENGIDYQWDDTTILGQAIKAGRVDMVEALIKDGVDVKRPSLYATLFGVTIGILPLQQAVQGMTGSIADRFVGLGSNGSKENLSQIAIALIKAGCPVQTERFDAVIYALSYSDTELFEVALSKYNKDMLDYSSYTEDDFDARGTPIKGIHDDETIAAQKPLIESLMKKGVQFGFYDMAVAMQRYLDPGSKVYLNAVLFDVLTYMANQKTLGTVYGPPDNFNEENPQMVSPFDIATSGIWRYPAGKTATEPNGYLKVVSLFGEAPHSVFTDSWGIRDIDNSSDGTLRQFLRIISENVKREGANRAFEHINDPLDFAEWTADEIIRAFELLTKYNALYYQSAGDKMPLEYFCSLVPKSYMDLVEPYYPVFDWLVENGYTMYGGKDHLVYEDSTDAADFFSNYYARLEWNNTIPNDPTDPNAVTIAGLKNVAARNPEEMMWKVILEEAAEIFAGTRKGLSKEPRAFLKRRLYVENIKP